jgi:uncharacterized membrane protein YeaQ/YmgE (transglycosylase-associated protein family)
MFWHIIWMIVLGLIVGWTARLIVPGRNKMGWIATAVLGIVGAYVGGTLGSVVFPPHQFTITRVVPDIFVVDTASSAQRRAAARHPGHPRVPRRSGQ